MTPISLPCLALAGTLLLAPLLEAQTKAEFKVVVHSSNPASSLTMTQISRLFLKKETAWDDGRRVAPVDLTENSPTRAAFSKQVHRKSVAAIRSYWQQRIFSGSDVPPPEFATDAEVLAFVRTRPGAIGYVSAAADDAGVKPIRVVE